MKGGICQHGKDFLFLDALASLERSPDSVIAMIDSRYFQFLKVC